MAISFSYEHRPRYAVVRVDGDPAIEEFLSFIEALGRDSAGWASRDALIDLRSIRSLTAFTEHYAIGEAVARHMPHLRRVASVVPGDRITRVSEKTAQRSGVNLVVFTSEGEAISWLTAA